MTLIGAKAQDEALEALGKAVSILLEPLGFEESERFVWRRRSAWKIEEVDLVVRGGVSKHVLPSFRVLLPLTEPSRFGDNYHHIAQVNVARLLNPEGGPEFDRKVPTTTFGRKEFVQSGVAEISQALPWFVQFASPEVCKVNLSKFLKLGCPAYLDAQSYLDALSQ